MTDTCWICGFPLTPETRYPVDFMGVAICPKCERAQRVAQNNVRLPAWEAAHKRLAEITRGDDEK